MQTTPTQQPIKVWDLPTRVFHWSLVLCIIGSFTSAQLGGAAMVWHFRLGYAVLALLLFRLTWGFLGGTWSRFSSFIYSPSTVWRYVKGQGLPEQEIGHNPLGALSVFAMLLFLLLQISAGFLSDDEISNAGPLVQFASSAVVNAATFYHKSIGKLILLGLIVLHLGAIAHHDWIKKDNLVLPMINGYKLKNFSALSAQDGPRVRLLAALVFALCSALVAWLLSQT